jgi:hypothetical protein
MGRIVLEGARDDDGEGGREAEHRAAWSRVRRSSRDQALPVGVLRLAILHLHAPARDVAGDAFRDRERGLS